MGTGGVSQVSLRSVGADDGSVTTSRHVPGEPGVWIFLFGDMVVFGIFFATFMYQRSLAPELFDASRHTLSIGIGLTNTLILLTSSLFVVTAIRAVRSSQRGAAQLLFAGATVCGLAFIGLKAWEYTAKVSAGHVPHGEQLLPLFLHPDRTAPLPRADRNRGVDPVVLSGTPSPTQRHQDGRRRRRGMLLASRRPAVDSLVPTPLSGELTHDPFVVERPVDPTFGWVWSPSRSCRGR